MAPDRDADERANEAIAAWHAGDSDAAIAEFEILVRNAGDDPRPAFMLGAYLWDAGRATEAIPHLKRAVAEWPASERASRILFHALWDAGREEEAAQCLRKLLALRKVEDLEAVLRDVERHLSGDAV